MIHLEEFGIYWKRSCFNYDTGKDIYFIIIFLSLYHIQLKITAAVFQRLCHAVGAREGLLMINLGITHVLSLGKNRYKAGRNISWKFGF